MWMYFFAFVSLSCVFLNMIVLISTSNKEDVLDTLFWSHGEMRNCGDDCLDLYTGMFSFFVKGSIPGISGDTDIKWSSGACTNDFCNDCEIAGKGVISFVVLSLFICFFSVYSNFMR